MARPAPRRQQQEDLVLGVLLSANPRSPYAEDLLLPFHDVCCAGRAAAVRTISHLRLDRSEDPLQQLWLLEAADQATVATMQTTQIPGLLAALLQQQQEEEDEEEEQQQQLQEDVSMKQPATAAGGNPNSSSSAAPCPRQPSVPVRPAGKPRGARITHLAVVGELALATTQQLEQLLDALPATQHLQHLVLRNPDQSMETAKWTDWWDQYFIAQEVSNCIKGAVDDADAYRYINIGANSTTSNSSHSVYSRTEWPDAPYNHAPTGSWRSSCHTLVANMLGKRIPGDSMQSLGDLGPLLGALQQQHLQVLYLHGLDATGMPLYAAALQPLRAVHLDGVQGADTPGVLGTLVGLPNLRHLGIAGLQPWGLAEAPIPPGALPHLTSLDLSSTGWTTPTMEQVCNICSLRYLDLSGSWYYDYAPQHIPDCISQLTGLEQLVVYGTEVDSLPGSMTALTSLSRLVWAQQFDSSPQQLDVVWQLQHLQDLTLGCKTITVLPAGIGQLTGLTKLSLKMRLLARLPDTLSMLGRLEQLNIRAQCLEYNVVRPSPLQLQPVCGLRALRRLDLHSKNACLPAAIGQLTGLSRLTFSGRCGGALPDGLSMLVGLERLQLSLDNPLLALPEGMTALTKLTALIVPPAWVPHAPQAMQAFVRAFK